MLLTLDLFSKKTRLFYIGLVITIITFSFISVAGIFNLQYKSRLDPLYDTLLFLATMVSIAFILIAGMGLLRTYVKDGELVLADDYLIIDKVKILLSESRQIDMEVTTRTVKSFILTRNRIKIIDKNGSSYNRRFVIKSYNQDQEFTSVIDKWQSDKSVFNISYHN